MIEKDLLKIFPDPMKLVFEEKIYKKFLILTKKRYMALTCSHDGDAEDDLTIRGVLLARRDNARWVRSVYEYIVRSIMSDTTFEELMDRLNGDLLNLFRMNVPLKQFIISKTLGKDYAVRPLPEDEKKRAKRLSDLGISTGTSSWRQQYDDRSKPAHVQLAEKMKRRGTVVEAGSRIEFVVVRHASPDSKLFERIEDPSYVREQGDLVRIDPLYYAQNLVNPADQVMEVCFKKKKVMEGMVAAHARFRLLMEELLWRCHPYEFRDRDGNALLHPDAARFARNQKKQSVAVKKKPATVKKKTTTTKKSKPVEPSPVEVALDLLRK
jgi:DNA polymerase elongation subunit (family B)